MSSFSQAPAVTTALSRQNPFTLVVALDESSSASGDLFWDDGVSVDDANANYARTDYAVNDGALASRLSVGNFPMQGLGVERVKVYGLQGLVRVILVLTCIFLQISLISLTKPNFSDSI